MKRVAIAIALLAAACDPQRAAEAPVAAPTSTPETPEAVTPIPKAPGCGQAAAAGASHPTTLQHRAFTLVVPEHYARDTPYPVVFVFHGDGGSGDAVRARFDLEHVAKEGAIFVYPNAHGGSWDLDTPAASSADVAYFDAMLLAIHNSLCVDERRIFAVGFSNGAYMANQLGCRRGDRIRGVVTHSGGGPYETDGHYDAQGNLVCPQKAVASLVIHGNADATVPPSEGAKSVDHWTFANRCGKSTSPASTAPCVTFDGCAQFVGACRIPALGHAVWTEAAAVTWHFIEALR